MFVLHNLERLFVFWAFLLQIILIIYFVLRRWRFDLALRYGWIIYALGIPSLAISLLLLVGGTTWALWLGGFLYFTWAVFGYIVEYMLGIQWRHPPRWPVLVPYVMLYLATNMFYWWPLALIGRPLWYAYGFLFIISTTANLASHKPARTERSSH